MIESFFSSLVGLIDAWGYLGIFTLMAVESSFVPFPSEIVIPPAAYLAQQGEMNIYLVVLFGILGSLVGATLNYFLAMWLGRPIVYKLISGRFGKVFLLSKAKIEKAESYFLKYGRISTFVGRLVPGIRQLISLPAGFSRMPFWSFLLWTGLGAGIWVVILALQGYLVGVYKEFFVAYVEEIILGFVFFGVLVWALTKWIRKK